MKASVIRLWRCRQQKNKNTREIDNTDLVFRTRNRGNSFENATLSEEKLPAKKKCFDSTLIMLF